MKKLLLIVVALIIIGALGYGIFYLISSDPEVASPATSQSTGQSVDLSDNQSIWEWREENRTGVSSETGLMKSWPAEGPQLIWSNLDLPRGHSSPAFGNNTIYLTGNVDRNDVLVVNDAGGKVNGRQLITSWNPSNPEAAALRLSKVNWSTFQADREKLPALMVSQVILYGLLKPVRSIKELLVNGV
jgi:hypothetical protein